MNHQQDVIYGRKFGTALTLDIFTPESGARGIGLIYVVSGGWYSSHEAIQARFLCFVQPLLRHGYTVFALVTSSRPRFTIPEIVPDVHRAVRFIRTNAAEYNVDPEQLGIYGISAGAHLSLMVGLTGGDGDPEAEDPIDRISSAVQSVGEFCGPTDFLNYGDSDSSALGEGILAEHRAPFDFHDYDSEARVYVSVSPQRYLEIGRDISPITHATAAAPPVLAIHGTDDELVPLQQSQSLIDKLNGLGACAELIEVPEAGHGWQEMGPQMEQLAQWFNRTLSTRRAP